ncbi:MULTISPECIES: phage tail length tape measure family protein [unclassified Sulfitobacter]|uniref:phage tail length tape measure family protein n=1 Tax=unclassified Sulfitobacter TaxID=196795 RepID=UPI00374568DB
MPALRLSIDPSGMETGAQKAESALDRVTREAAEAEGAVDKVSAGMKTAGKSSKDMASEATKSASSAKRLTSATQAAATKVELLSSAQVQAAATAGELSRANVTAAGSVSNLTAQFNDIGIMLASGQNPLQLALQQGTQITQVIGPMGAAGAVRSLGSALLGMLSPVSLITVGSIAAGAAMFNWLTSSTDGAEDLDDALANAGDQLSEYIDLLSQADALGGERFEQTREQIRMTSQAYADLIAIAKIEAFQGIDALNDSLAASVLSASYTKTAMADVARLLETNITNASNITVWKENRAQVKAFKDELEGLRDAASLEDQYEAALRLRDAFKSTVDVNGELTGEQLSFWKTLSQSIQQMEIMGAAVRAQASAMTEVEQAAARAASYYAASRIEGEKSMLAATTLLGTLQQEAQIQALIATYGADSARVAEARLAAERDIFVEQTNSRDIADSLKVELIAAWDAANGIAGAGMAGNIGAAADQAQRMANELQRSVENAISLANQGVGDVRRAQINYDFRDDPIGRAGALAGAEFDARSPVPAGADSTIRNVIEGEKREFVKARVEAAKYNEQLQDWRKGQSASKRSSSRSSRSGGSRSSNSAAKEINETRDAYDSLMASLDPVVAATQRFEDAQETVNAAMKAGHITSTEAAEAYDLARERFDEAVASAEKGASVWDNFKETGASAIDKLIEGTMSLKDAVTSLIKEMVIAIAKKALLGNGAGGSATDSLGSIIMSSFGFADGAAFSGGRVTAFATGGVVSGPTLFPMRGGTGLMGEAGPEAIMPLARTSSGKLGVQASGAVAPQRQSLEVVLIAPPGFTAQQRQEVQGISLRVTEAKMGASNRAQADQKYLSGGR